MGSLLTLLRSGGAGAPPWTPASLPDLVLTLDVARSRSLGLLWQDAAKTTPAVADGDPVRVAVCPHTGVELTAPGDSQRPLLWDELLDGTLWSLSFDGIDDSLYGTPAVAWADQTHAVWAAVTPESLAAAYAAVAITGILDGAAGAGWRMCLTLSTPPWGTYGGADRPANTTLSTGTGYVLAMNGGGYRLDGASDGTYPASNPTSGAGVWVGSEGASRYVTGRIHGVVMASAVAGGDDVARLDAYLSDLLP